MKKAATSFKPLEIDRNRTEKTRLERQAKFKIHSLEEGQKEALKYIDTVDLKLFSDDFVAYTIKHILEKNDAFRGLNISTAKTLDLLDINLSKLENLQLQFEQNVAELFWDNSSDLPNLICLGGLIGKETENEKISIRFKKLPRYAGLCRC